VKSEAKGQTPSVVTPQLVKRVHELYEELGLEDVRAVENWERAGRQTRAEDSRK
jgi:H+-transporting ATPase